MHPFYPGLVTYDEFGIDLFSFLDRRLVEEGEYTLPAGTKASWLALLLSVLACGVQFSADPIKDRDLRSKVFGITIPPLFHRLPVGPSLFLGQRILAEPPRMHC